MFINKFFGIIGLQYFNYTELTVKNITERPSIYRLGYCLLRFVVLMFSIAYSLQYTQNRSKITNSVMLEMHRAREIASLFFLLSGILSNYLATVKMKKFHYNLFRILKLFENEFSHQMNLNKVIRKFYVKIILLWIFCTTIFFMRDNLLILLHNPRFFVIYAAVFLFSVSLAYIVLHVDLINLLIKNLIQVVRNMESFNVTNGHYIKSFYIRGNTHHLNLLFNQDSIIKNIRNCRKIYNLIYKAVELIDQSFGYCILFFLVLTTISLSLDGFTISISLIDPKENTPILSKNNRFNLFYK